MTTSNLNNWSYSDQDLVSLTENIDFKDHLEDMADLRRKERDL